MKSKDINIDTIDLNLRGFGQLDFKDNKNIRIDKQNNSNKMICFNILFGIAVSLLHMITEVNQFKIRDYEWMTNSIAFLLTFILIMAKKREMKMSLHFLIITLCNLFGLFFKLYTSRLIIIVNKDNVSDDRSKNIVTQTSVFAYINLSCCLIVFLGSLCFDRKHKFKWLHFLSIIFVLLSFALYLYFNIIIATVIEIVQSNQLYFTITSIILLSITPLYQQIYFRSGSNIYHYLEFQGLVGFVFFLYVSWLDNELNHLINVDLSQFDFFAVVPYGMYLIGMVIFIMIYPFYLKKTHCVISTMFLGWKYLFIRQGNWLLCIGENALFFIGAVCFNTKKITTIASAYDLLDSSIDKIEDSNQNEFSMSDGSFLLPLMNERFNDSVDTSFDKFTQHDTADRQLAFYKQNKMTSVNKYL